MGYCENCRVVSERERCPLCGTKKLRDVREDDFCLLTEQSSQYGETLTEIFHESGIPCTALPYGRGTETRLGLPLENYRLFVPYLYLEKAENIMRQIEDEKTRKFKTRLLRNAHQFCISEKLERKIRKKANLTEENFSDFIIDVIKRAEKITDGGKITTCPDGGHYLFCYSRNATVAFHSTTYEILSLTLR